MDSNEERPIECRGGRHSLELKGRRLVEFMNVGEFIDAVRATRLLWDPQDSGYGNKNLRDDAWFNVAATMFGDLGQRPVHEQDEISFAVQKKWRCLRTCYNRELLKKNEEKNCKNGSKRKEYVYFWKLKFLDTITKRVPQVAEEGSNEDNSINQQFIKCIPQKRLHEKHEDCNQDGKRTRWSNEQLSESEQIYFKQDEDISEEFDANGSVANDDDNNIILNIQSPPHTSTFTNAHTVNEDEDKMFLLSLLSDLKRVPQENKLKVKSDILLMLSNGQTPGSYNSPFNRHS